MIVTVQHTNQYVLPAVPDNFLIERHSPKACVITCGEQHKRTKLVTHGAELERIWDFLAMPLRLVRKQPLER